MHGISSIPVSCAEITETVWRTETAKIINGKKKRNLQKIQKKILNNASDENHF